MAFSIYQDIKIGNFRFSRSNGVEIRKSTNTIGATAIIRLPISAIIENKNEGGGLVETSQAIKVGDPVSILLGYHTKQQDYENVEFTGFVKSISPKTTLEVECENIPPPLRQCQIKESWKTTTLQEVLDTILAGTSVSLANEVPSMTLEPFYIKNEDGAFALQRLVDDYGLSIYFKSDSTLYAGLAHNQDEGETTLVLNGDDQNVIDATNLKFRNEEDVKLKIKAIAIQKDNSKLEAEAGDADGALRTLTFHNITSEAELMSQAEQEIKKYKYSGYEGTLKGFFIPIVEPGYKVNLKDENFTEREGSYFVESVKVNYGTSGIRRETEISIKL